MPQHDHKHDHAHDHGSGGGCCGSGGDRLCGDVGPVGNVNAAGRSFRVNGLDCAEEVAILNKALGPEVGGTEHLAFDVINGRMTVLDGARPLSDDRIVKLIGGAGMSAKPWDAESASADQAAHLARQRSFTALSGGFWAAGLVWHVVESGPAGAVQIFSDHGAAPMPLAEIGLFFLAIVFGAWLVAPKAWSAARRLAPDMNLLMIVAVAGAIGLGAYFEAATVAFFFSLSLYLESWSVGRARNAVSALLDLAPPTARVIRDDGAEEDVPAAQVAVGDRFVVRGGDRIALDGEVVEGMGGVDQAPITGESALVPKEPGDEVYAGTINGEGTLTVRATKAASDTVLSKIIRMVGDAHSRRAEVEQWVAKFARVYTPIVMVAAIADRPGAAAPLRRRLGVLDLQRAGAPGHRLPLRAGHLDAGVHRRGARLVGAQRRAHQGRRLRRGAGAHHGAGDRQDRHHHHGRARSGLGASAGRRLGA